MNQAKCNKCKFLHIRSPHLPTSKAGPVMCLAALWERHDGIGGFVYKTVQSWRQEGKKAEKIGQNCMDFEER